MPFDPVPGIRFSTSEKSSKTPKANKTARLEAHNKKSAKVKMIKNLKKLLFRAIRTEYKNGRQHNKIIEKIGEKGKKRGEEMKRK